MLHLHCADRFLQDLPDSVRAEKEKQLEELRSQTGKAAPATVSAREKEIARARQPGRSPDECKAMQKVDAIYGDAFKRLLHQFPTQESECLGFHSLAPEILETQRRRAEAIRRQCDGGRPGEDVGPLGGGG